MDDQFEDGPVCDFCEISVEKNETLQPIYVGEQPQPNPHYLSETSKRGGVNSNLYKAKYDALRRALDSCYDVELNESNVVNDIKVESAQTDFTTERTQKVGARLKIHPKSVTYEPDAEVCDTCAEMFSSLDD